MAVREGTGAIVKFVKGPDETMSSVMKEVEALTDTDIAQLSAGIKNGSLTY